MLSRAALRCVHRSTFSGRLPACVASRGLSSDTSTTLTAPAHVSVSPDAYERFDPSKWLTDETDPHVRAELARIRQAEDDAIAFVTKDIPDIDWAAWKEEIQYPGLVDEMKAAHDAIPVPDFEAERERLLAEVNEVFEPFLAKLKKHALDAEESSKAYKERLEEITYLHDNITELPIDEFLAKYPAVKKTLEDDIVNNKWFV